MPLLILVVLCLAWAGCIEEPPKVRTAPSWFVMSEQFTPSGFMGEGGERNVLKLYVDRCPKRASGAVGTCYTFDYRPQYLPEVPEEPGWFGVVWQSPPNNWGSRPGKVVEAGADRIRFKMRGSRPGTAQVAAGGMGLTHPVPGESYPYKDAFVIGNKDCAFSSDDWTECTLPLRDRSGDYIFEGEDELEILGAFQWSFKNPKQEAITLYFDDIVWEAN